MELLLKDGEYLQISKKENSSLRNFVARLICKLFTGEERMQSNVSGSQGKLQLDPENIITIKNAIFATYLTVINNKPSI